MSMNMYTHADANVRKTWFLVLVFFAVLIGIGWFLGYTYDAPEILYVAVVVSLFMNVGSYWYSDKIVIALTGGRPADRGSHPELWNVVENLSITAGLPMPRLYIVDDLAPNAFATGRNRERAVVAVTTGLLAILNQTELEGVIAHELSHIGNKDMLLSTVAVVLVGTLSLISDMVLRSGLMHGDRGNRKSSGPLALLGLVAIILAPLVGFLMQLVISRKREYLADATGALLTRYPEGLAGALEKISSENMRLSRVHQATAHLFITNPFGERNRSGAFFATLFSTHPPVNERIARLRGMDFG